MMIDYTITVGNLFEIAAIIGGGFIALGNIKSNIGTLSTEVSKMQAEIEKLSEVVARQAKAEGRLDAMDTRLSGFDRDIRELRHGDGFIKGPRGIDREYNP